MAQRGRRRRRLSRSGREKGRYACTCPKKFLEADGILKFFRSMISWQIGGGEGQTGPWVLSMPCFEAPDTVFFLCRFGDSLTLMVVTAYIVKKQSNTCQLFPTSSNGCNLMFGPVTFRRLSLAALLQSSSVPPPTRAFLEAQNCKE